MFKDTVERHQDTCPGCKTNNPFLCWSFAGKAPRHAADHAAWQKRRAAAQQVERAKESVEAVHVPEDAEAAVFGPQVQVYRRQS
jgi:hypothetical protein